MRIMPLEKRKISSSRMVLGCMGFGGSWDNSPISNEDVLKGEKAVDAALSTGITMFDHANIYTRGKAEKVFGEILKSQPGLREKIVIQSKCGIRFQDEHAPGRYDFSKEHILNSVDEILSRLGVQYLDLLLLHRPDPLMEPEEVGEAFAKLELSGKVRHFGVSNMNMGQIQLLQAYCDVPLIVNQLEMSLHKLDWVEQGVLVNQKAGLGTRFAEGLIEYSMVSDIQIQAWSPLARGIYTGNESLSLTEADIKTKELVEKMALEKETTREAIVLGWLLRHPAKIQPVIGTTDPERIKNCEDAVRQAEQMTREEWYSLYVASRGNAMP
ncbi:aldo/keto reductase [Heyndrickxia shackletonii]|uniref:Aldo/keto reductase n=1 Tax=Heyndrickxia shackletonii TaxID=157838 RepID=A0A0Q3WS82_9BACI|nr:aldo/keto reductase [Heyndrickxia shackletonii]KQL50786.1 aldo/keto reductase [Heyndrickxia shackletonii]NEY99743.1 aldo/keto reductase [Heyndrickxia shackletonii]